ncbi:MAG: 2-polyprenyl-3-methyl-6-methoxy-1,4-benzoquinone monooxygenase [Gammaproteobacteria bacterium]
MRNVQFNRTDRLVNGFDRVLRTLWGTPQGTDRPNPAGRSHPDHNLPEAARQRAGRLMRVNLAGEVAAQALYHGQSLTARAPAVAARMQHAANEENDHLLWCRARLGALETRGSLLNPLWYAGALVIGAGAGALGDAASLGFLEETERQVVAHLNGHLKRLPEADRASHRVLEQMSSDEAQHGRNAHDAGARRPPPPVRLAMRLASRVMTTTAYWL